ncbi:unnamed protein product [Acanthoscelides obtectus]|uniref:Uncharacterized protein n=1 Tax=Acanthoscelides obtectus TaxID=200917 RepID=A0A9P0JMD6_ACAOB|nr:unnamed protein product [Acanthoscelides obtectus]CAK1655077.1 hypothetical protein AOBTE_LOCUS19013 [Acanthoscelides obtectus]
MYHHFIVDTGRFVVRTAQIFAMADILWPGRKRKCVGLTSYSSHVDLRLKLNSLAIWKEIQIREYKTWHTAAMARLKKAQSGRSLSPLGASRASFCPDLNEFEYVVFSKA